MTKARSSIDCPRPPIGLRFEEAARFVGMAPGLFERQMHEGRMPPPRRFGEARIWDADELLAAFRRPPHEPLDLKPGATPMHDDGHLESDPYDAAPQV